VKAYHHTYALPVTLSNCSNNYGPYQFPEKLIPLLISNAWKGKPLPIYGDGQNIRDWLHVTDHCAAIWSILKGGQTGETYNIGGESERTNIPVVEKFCDSLEELIPISQNIHLKLAKSKIRSYRDLITFVADRPGHDRRYAISFDKIRDQLNWLPEISFEEGIRETIRWYLRHESWIEHIVSGEYRNWIKKHYGSR
jgi:dTDP-glucose 4,6-dehydratase